MIKPEQLAVTRFQRGLTQKQCADAVGVDRVTWARWEKGVQWPPKSIETLDAVTAWLLAYDPQQIPFKTGPEAEGLRYTIRGGEIKVRVIKGQHTVVGFNGCTFLEVSQPALDDRIRHSYNAEEIKHFLDDQLNDPPHIVIRGGEVFLSGCQDQVTVHLVRNASVTRITQDELNKDHSNE